MNQVKERYGGAKGCTHLLEMLYPVGTTAYQTVFAFREQKLRQSGISESEALRRKGPPPNSCYAFADESPIMNRIKASAAK